MDDPVYVSHVRLERIKGPLRIAHLPGESHPVALSVHGPIAAHYGRTPEEIEEPHSSTIDYIVAATGG